MVDRAEELEVTRKIARVFDLVVAGNNFRQAGDEVGISRATASRYYDKAMLEYKVPDIQVQEWRIMLSNRFDSMIKPLMKAILDEKTPLRDIAEAVRAVTRVEQRRARMLGLDKPTKIDVTLNVPALDPPEAAKRQRKRLEDAGFLGLSTAPPKGITGPRDVEAEVVNGTDPS